MKFLFWIYLLFLVCASAVIENPADPDLWHRLAVGEYLWQHHRFPTGETFSYLSDYHDVADHEWGSGVIFYAVWQLGGGTAIVLTKIATLCVTLALVIHAGMQGRRPTVLFTVFYALVMLALLPQFQSAVRCMVFTHVIFALWLYWFQRERHGRPVATWLYPVTMLVWANLHGGFVTGLFWLLCVAAVEAVFRRDWKIWLLRFALSLVVTLANPYGWKLWTVTARALTVPRGGFGEWAPVIWWPAQMSYPGYKLLLICVPIALAIQIRRRGWGYIDKPAVFLIGIFALVAFDSARHTSLFALVAGALVPDFFPLKWPHVLVIGPARRLVVMAMSSTLVLVPFYTCILSLPGDGFSLSYPSMSSPVASVDFLKRENVQGNLLVPFNYGSYALWHLRGRMRVSMDGRYDLVYSRATYDRVDGFFAARPGWQSLLNDPAPAAILVPREAAVLALLRADPRWTEAWHDASDVVFLPRAVAN